MPAGRRMLGIIIRFGSFALYGQGGILIGFYAVELFAVEV